MWSRRWSPRLLLLPVAVLAAITLQPPPAAWACSCAEAPAPQESLERADAVFIGEVVELTERRADGGPYIDARLAVTEVFAGEVHETVEVRTHAHSATCGYGFQLGRTDLVYARVDDGNLTTGLCSRSAPVEDADDDLAAFGEGSAPLAGQRLIPEDARGWMLPAVAGALVVGALITMLLVQRRREPDRDPEAS